MKLSSLDNRTFDVAVCGAGSAGVAAACSAAKAGARVALFERHGFGGGIMTAAMIHTFDAIKSCVDNDVFVVGGVALELLEEIRAIGGNVTDDNPGEAHVVHPEMHKIDVDRLLARHGVTALFHAPVVGVLMEGDRVTGVEAALRDGRARVRAAVTVDGTGDADIAFHAGAAWTLDTEVQAMTYHFRLGGIDPAPDWSQWEEITRRAMQDAHGAGEIGVFGGPWVIRMADDEISLNTTRVHGNPVDPLELSRAEQDARAQMLRIWDILRRRAPGLARSHIISGASQLHIRESRKIAGDYTLTEDDILRGTRFPDAIAVGAWPVDIHPSNGRVGVHPHKENPPAPYEIPFRCLLPRGVEKLLVAGKPISTTHRAHGSTRVPGTSLATGEAAGLAAAGATGEGVTPRAYDTQKLRAALAARGAIVSVDSLPSATA
jgi:glycine/D-amino acid oxidase-like deaminating enzyme